MTSTKRSSAGEIIVFIFIFILVLVGVSCICHKCKYPERPITEMFTAPLKQARGILARSLQTDSTLQRIGWPSKDPIDQSPCKKSGDGDFIDFKRAMKCYDVATNKEIEARYCPPAPKSTHPVYGPTKICTELAWAVTDWVLPSAALPTTYYKCDSGDCIVGSDTKVTITPMDSATPIPPQQNTCASGTIQGSDGHCYKSLNRSCSDCMGPGLTCGTFINGDSENCYQLV